LKIREINQEDLRKVPREKRKQIIKERADLLKKIRKEEKEEYNRKKSSDYYYSHRSRVLAYLKERYERKKLEANGSITPT